LPGSMPKTSAAHFAFPHLVRRSRRAAPRLATHKTDWQESSNLR
jgi:hypothetical protein